MEEAARRKEEEEAAWRKEEEAAAAEDQAQPICRTGRAVVGGRQGHSLPHLRGEIKVCTLTELGTQHQGSHKFKIEDAIKDIA